MASMLGGSITGQSSQNNVNGITQTNFRPQDLAAIQGSQQGMNAQANNVTGLANQLSQQGQGNISGINTNFRQFNPQLNTNFAAAPGGLDAYSQQLIASQTGQNQAALNTLQNQIGAQNANNPALANILRSQAAMSNQLSNNPLALQAGGQQYQRQIQAQQLGNQALLSQAQQGMGAQQAGNMANLQQLGGLGQVLGLSQAGLGAQQSALGQNLGVGQALGQQSTDQGTAQRQGSILENMSPWGKKVGK